jgi:16S rRNA C967 or C1407 C5-methylase (RsmB/RsmF family)
MKIEGKKYKKIARGEINIFKKYFIGDKLKIEKTVYLTPYQSFLNSVNIDSPKVELNSGKILLTINLLEPYEHLKKENVKEHNKKNQKKNINQDNNSNENYDDLMSNQQFDDNLSDLSISIIDESDEERKGLELNQFVNDDYIQKLKELMASDYEKILPKDIEKLKQMNEMLYSKFSELSNSYNETLFALNSTNEEIRQKAKKYYDDYKKIKKDVYKGRVELKKKNKELRKEIDINNEDNKALLNEVENLKNETQLLKNKLNIQSEEDIKNNTNENNDINSLIEILKKLNNLGYDVVSSSGLNDEEKIKLKNILNLNLSDSNNENSNNNENNYLKNTVKYCYFKTLDEKDDKVTKELKDKKINFYKYNGNLDFKYSNVYYIDKYKSILETNSFKDGFLIIQDASSAFLIDKLYDFIIKFYSDFNREIKVLDVCSAPGGKIISLYKLVIKNYKNFYFEARDISIDKINKIKENFKRLKIDDIKLEVKDASKYDEKDYECYDIVLCDVPCSGLGVVNKKPDILLKTNDDKIKSLSVIQKSILETSKKYVKKGGILSYSTCTITREENQDIIIDFLHDNVNFEKIFEKQIEINDDSIADGFYMCFMRKV